MPERLDFQNFKVMKKGEGNLDECLAEEKAAEQARLQAAREAEMARRLQEADEAAQSKEDETPPPPQNPDPF